MLQGDSIEELLDLAGAGSLSAIVLREQAASDGVPKAQLREHMAECLAVMRASAVEGLNPDLRSLSGMTGGFAAKLQAFVTSGRALGGDTLGRAAYRALAIAECNACMGKIVAAPTAGSCGIVPGVLLTVQEDKGYTDEALMDALFTAAGIGRVIAKRASISGAAGGCQAECGSAAAMAAAALVELGGGTPAQSAAACAFALMNSLGLVCDPVGGLVEIPCVFRNVMGAANALTAADMALAGIPCMLPVDDVIDAMRRVGDAMPTSLRETGEGGCASCRICMS